MDAHDPTTHAGDEGTSTLGAETVSEEGPSTPGPAENGAYQSGVTALPGGPHSAPAAVPTQKPRLTFAEVPDALCICPLCHVDKRSVELVLVLPETPAERPCRYPGQPQITNLIHRRNKLVCPECKGEFCG